MRILIEQSGYPLTNMGDLAMLQVTIARLQKFWPDAQIEVFASALDRLAKFCPSTHPLKSSSHDMWFYPFFKPLYGLVPHVLTPYLPELEWKFRRNFPSIARSLILFKLKIRKGNSVDFNSFIKAIDAADLVVCSGGGYITDVFAQKTITALGIISLAAKLGKPTVMLGQGLGPLKNPKLYYKAKDVLPSLDLITLREKRSGVSLLDSFGIPPNRFNVTGDDAIELAYNARNPELGNGIGINLRIADYANVSSSSITDIKLVLHTFAKHKDAPLIPVPIEFLELRSDCKAIQQLLKGYDDISNGGQNLTNPIEIIKQAGLCRVVITGSYHAGVFALSQGIPVVALIKSEYYKDKFMGLADQFGVGCEMVFLNDENLREKLMSAIENAWILSEALRPKLLKAAQEQIKLGHAAYQRVYDIAKDKLYQSSISQKNSK